MFQARQVFSSFVAVFVSALTLAPFFAAPVFAQEEVGEFIDLGEISKDRPLFTPRVIGGYDTVVGTATTAHGKRPIPVVWSPFSGLHAFTDVKGKTVLSGSHLDPILFRDSIYRDNKTFLIPAAKPFIVYGMAPNGGVFGSMRAADGWRDFYWDARTPGVESVGLGFTRIAMGASERTVAADGNGSLELWSDRFRSSVLRTFTGSSPAFNSNDQLAICERDTAGALHASVYNRDLSLAFSREIVGCSPSASPCCHISAISDAGSFVGEVNENGRSYPFRYSTVTGWSDLNDKLQPFSGWVLQTANATGRTEAVVGVGLHNGKRRGFLFNFDTFYINPPIIADIPGLLLSFAIIDNTRIRVSCGEVAVGAECEIGGSVIDSRTANFAGWPVTLQRFRNSKWRKIETRPANASGDVVFWVKRKPGTVYRLVIPQFNVQVPEHVISTAIQMP